jgi:hypothetical protein
MKTIEKFMETEHAKGEIDDDAYDYFEELLDQYNDAVRNNSRRKAEELKEEIMMIYYTFAPVTTAESAAAPSAPRGRPQVVRPSETQKKKNKDKVVMTGVSVNKSQDMKFWNEQSARELRTQITLRGIGRIGDYGFKTRQQLLKIVEGFIKEGKW